MDTGRGGGGGKSRHSPSPGKSLFLISCWGIISFCGPSSPCGGPFSPYENIFLNGEGGGTFPPCERPFLSLWGPFSSCVGLFLILGRLFGASPPVKISADAHPRIVCYFICHLFNGDCSKLSYTQT